MPTSTTATSIRGRSMRQAQSGTLLMANSHTSIGASMGFSGPINPLKRVLSPRIPQAKISEPR
ncbi:MAG TPA: hypothetical protein VLD40_04305, partial [Dissulfurispiraceae bacterium]|nr:hypothetical protein [Dissulfurispiraceae bacterium]